MAEIVVVDTGSTDQTANVAAAQGAKIHSFAWCDSFAEARNESIRRASGDWIFWLDCDEQLDEVNRERLRVLFANLPDENVAYTMAQRSVLEAGTHSAAVVQHVRLFRNHAEIRWQYRVHEQILPSIRVAGGALRHTDVVIDHVGFRDPALQEGKVERNLRLLLLELQDRPDDPFVLFNLASVYLGRGQGAEALPLLWRSLALSQPGDTITPKLHSLIARAQHQQGQLAEELEACRQGRHRVGDQAELLFWEALVSRDLGRLPEAVACLTQLLATPAGGHFTGADDGMHTYKARLVLGEVYRQQGRADAAEEQWRQVVSQHPTFVPAWTRLAELYAEQARWDEVDRAAEHVRSDSAAAAEVRLHQARGLLAPRQFAQARQCVEPVLRQNPRAVQPRILLSHALLQEGQDWEAAEQALREVLRLDPRQEESWRNLVTLLRQERRLGEALAACQAGRMYHPESADLSLLEALILHERGDRAEAEACLRHFLRETPTDAEDDFTRTRRREAGHHLAVLLQEQNRRAEAATQWQALVSEFPRHTPAWLELAEGHLAEGHWDELESTLRALAAIPGQAAEADLFRARAFMVQGHFAASRQLLDRLIAAHPKALKPRLALSYAYLQEGRDWAAAERTLRDVLGLDPNHAEARQNLALVQEKQGRFPTGSSPEGEQTVRPTPDNSRPNQGSVLNPLRAYFDQFQEGPGVWKWLHYFDIYHRHLAKFVGREVTVVEVGVYSGGSMLMWRRYFGPNSRIHGIDIEEACKAYEGDGITIHIGDQADRAFWQQFRERVPSVDVLIDDGGHLPEQQKVTLEEMLPHLSPGGVYLCEDIHGLHNPFSAFVHRLADNLNATVRGPDDPEINMLTTPFQSAIQSLHFYPYVVVIEKAAAPVEKLVSAKRGTQWQPFL